MPVFGRAGSIPSGVPIRLAQQPAADIGALTPAVAVTSCDSPVICRRTFIYQALFATVVIPPVRSLVFTDIGAEAAPLLRTTVEAVAYR